MGAILATARAILLVVTMAIFLLCYAVSLLVSKNTPERAFRLRRNWVKLGIWIMGIKIKQEGKMATVPALYVGNHKTLSDPIVAARYIDAYVIAKAEVANIPVLKQGANMTGIIYVKRDSMKSRAATRQAYLETVENGYNVLVYPEGTTSSEVTTLPFKKGTFRVAADKGFAVVPIAIDYKSPKDLWSEGGLIKQYLKQFGKWRTHVQFWIGEPLLMDDGEALVNLAQKQVDDKLIEMKENWSKS